MLQIENKMVYLSDYRPPDFLIRNINLYFKLNPHTTTVHSHMEITKNSHKADVPLVLDGEGLELKAIYLNGSLLDKDFYQVDEEHLIISAVPGFFTLEIINEIHPQANKALEGLYISKGIFCTQCEAQGFRHITYYLDRPDVMTTFTTTIEADKTLYPVLLSNGNLIAQGIKENNQHWVTWQDPSKKPCYLFALVAGQLGVIVDSFTTKSNRKVALKAYANETHLDQCKHALDCLKKAMRWDEEVFGREYDLDIYMIVAVDDFNSGAMENKGLNIFNSQCMLANAETATDRDYEYVLSVIGHEYFHNWTGNRITLRDWFELSIKEGMTIFRDQEFTADMTSRAVKRIEDARYLRSAQFPEDDSPMAHSVRPEAYMEIRNFYTATVYHKGAEVARMLQTWLGKENFRKGMDWYFKKYDGQAVTAENFLKAMEEANRIDLSQFKLWYTQAGTPILKFHSDYDSKAKKYTLEVEQSCAPTPGQVDKQPFQIPLAIGLLGQDGRDLALHIKDGEYKILDHSTAVLNIKRAKEVFEFTDVPVSPIPSLLRNFSAPVKIHTERSNAELAFLLAHDQDAFVRWDASQTYAVRLLVGLIQNYQQKEKMILELDFIKAIQNTLLSTQLDIAFIDQVLAIPSEIYLAEQMKVVDVIAIHEARNAAKKALAENLKNDFVNIYHKYNLKIPYQFTAQDAAQRSLKNLCLDYLMTLEEKSMQAVCLEQFYKANNMTDRIYALDLIANSSMSERLNVLHDFYEQWHKEPLVINKWLAVQARSQLPGTFKEVQKLLQHPAFNIENPNNVRAVIGTFAMRNPLHFHAENGEGYQFFTDQILKIDQFNSQIAARLLPTMTRWKKFELKQQMLMKKQLERIVNNASISADVYEVASKALV